MGKHFINAVVSLVIGGGIVYLIFQGLPQDPSRQKVKIDFQEGTLEMDVEGRELDYATLLDRIFDHDFSRSGAMRWLRETQKMYALDDAALSEAIQELCPDKDTEEALERQKRLEECGRHRLVRDLRTLAEQRRAPFQYVGRQVQIGVPEEKKHQPSRNEANVCRTKGLLGKQILVINTENNKEITVHANKPYTCTGYNRYPDIQLNPDDAVELFGRPVAQYENAIAVIVL